MKYRVEERTHKFSFTQIVKKYFLCFKIWGFLLVKQWKWFIFLRNVWHTNIRIVFFAAQISIYNDSKFTFLILACDFCEKKCWACFNTSFCASCLIYFFLCVVYLLQERIDVIVRKCLTACLTQQRKSYHQLKQIRQKLFKVGLKYVLYFVFIDFLSLFIIIRFIS